MKIMNTSCRIACRVVNICTYIWAYCAVPLSADAVVRISGTVIDSKNRKAVEFAVVHLAGNMQKTAVSAVTDAHGKFTLANVEEGRYTLVVSFMGYKVWQVDVEAVNNFDELLLPLIVLEPDSKMLDAVTVSGSKSMIEHHIDKTVVNIADYIGTAGGNMVDILRKIAGVTVDSDGNVSLNGQAAAVYIDGRPSNLSKLDLLNMLYFIDAEEIDKVEIIQNPSAKYDAAGGNAIINIITKKNALNGFSGSVQGGGGCFLDTVGGLNGNGSLSVHYRNSWLSSSFNAGLRSNHSSAISKLAEEYGNMNRSSYSRTINESDSRSLRMTNNFYIDTKNIISINALAAWNSSDNHSNDHSLMQMYIDGQLIEQTAYAEKSVTRVTDYSADAGYEHIYRANSHKLTFNADYMHHRTSPWSYYESRSFGVAVGQGDELNQMWQNTVRQQVEAVSVRADYLRPLWRNASLEVGGKLSETATDNDLLRENSTVSGWQRDEGLSNVFRYHERIVAMYASLGTDFGKKWKAKAGLRWESTWNRGDWNTREHGDTVTFRKYGDFFPTLYAGYIHSTEQSLSLSYSMRIQRPDYGLLNPFRSYSSIYAYREGNPQLLPQYSHALNLGYSYNKLTLSAILQRAMQVITQEARIVAGGNVAYPVNAVTWSNFGRTDFIGTTASWSNLFPYLWWSFSLYVGGFYVSSVSPAYSNNGWFGNAHWENTFYIGRTLRAELIFNAQSPLPYGYYHVSGNLVASAGIRKTLWNHKASASLYIDDIFDSQRNHIISNRNGQRIESTNLWSSRQIRVSFSYRFRKAGQQFENLKMKQTENDYR